jgi:hypothetical protein
VRLDSRGPYRTARRLRQTEAIVLLIPGDEPRLSAHLPRRKLSPDRSATEAKIRRTGSRVLIKPSQPWRPSYSSLIRAANTIQARHGANRGIPAITTVNFCKAPGATSGLTVPSSRRLSRSGVNGRRLHTLSKDRPLPRWQIRNFWMNVRDHPMTASRCEDDNPGMLRATHSHSRSISID